VALAVSWSAIVVRVGTAVAMTAPAVSGTAIPVPDVRGVAVIVPVAAPDLRPSDGAPAGIVAHVPALPSSCGRYGGVRLDGKASRLRAA
jgi:hypothetical protein